MGGSGSQGPRGHPVRGGQRAGDTRDYHRTAQGLEMGHKGYKWRQGSEGGEAGRGQGNK